MMVVMKKDTLHKDLYWSPNGVLSYNKMINMIIGLRGVGKTYGTKMWLIRRFIEKGEQFIYVRRYKTHLKSALTTFFDKVKKEFPNHKFSVKGNIFYIDGKIAGYAIPLSAWQQYKSSEYPQVYTIFYDEFLKEKDGSHYIDNEPQALLNLIETIFREKAILGTENVRVIMASNSTTTANPFFTYFKLFLEDGKRFNTFKHNSEIIVELTDSGDFQEAKRNGRWGEVIKGTLYEEMSIDNKFIYDSDEFVEKRTKASKHLFNISFGSQLVGVWVDYVNVVMYCSKKVDVSARTYAIGKDNFKESNILVLNYREHYELMRLVSGFKNKQVRFETQIIRSTMYDIFTRLNVK